ncbi:hypothetical protein GPECTOR_17g898 [Gonium pectorale]|uniref:Sugar phosphate transporter domain-containing protein n=1 Tax=Gonium pectorale TaxID=33097 RepID=A0A150GLR9_GONPE|nr:hypothetical protein GPECTOR_17g898 [Gonium pectorale]|eukprot:KXZ50260.1 hypothetical protein GPECTOR_17g898 [Gonium pectorale]
MFPAPNMLLTVQFGIAVLLLKIFDFLGALHLEPLRWEVVKIWFPVNIIFVLMNATGFYALMSVSAGMFTVLKNLSNLLTILGDWYFFDKTYSWQVWACLGLMILSAAMGGWTDLSFSPSGYAWQLVNCVFTAAYSLHLSSVVRAAAGAVPGGHPSGGSHGGGAHAGHRHGGQASPDLLGHSSRDGSGGGAGPPARKRMSELSMVYYNNVLSVPPLVLLSLMFGEPSRLRDYPYLGNPEFTIVVLMGALLGFGVSFASIWCMSRTSATIYSLTGSMNKVVVAVVGMWYFAEPASRTNLLSIGMGLLAGFLFVFAKSAPTASHTGSGAAAGSISSGGGGGRESERLLGKDEEAERQALDDSAGVGGTLVSGPSGEKMYDLHSVVTVSGSNQPGITSRAYSAGRSGGGALPGGAAGGSL